MRQKDIPPNWDTVLKPMIDNAPKHSFTGEDGVEICYIAFDNGHDKSIFIAPGVVEPAYKYVEFAYDFAQLGFNIFVVDHRSQGASGRIIPRSDIVYVKDFAHYVADLAQFVDEVHKQYPHVGNTTRYLLGNSLGGLISANYIAQHQHPFSKVILSVPAMQVNTFPLPEEIARAATSFAQILGLGKRKLPGPKFFSSEHFTTNRATSCRERFDINTKVFTEYPQTCITGISFGWVGKIVKASRFMENYAKANVPVLLIQAAKDEVLKPGRQRKYSEKVTECTLKIYNEGKHNLLEEKDHTRDEVFKWIVDFLS
ncbi:alpha/beta fold hydrolase [Candidatus Uabimicrobium amorphum]|uniref:Lysophospholipase L2 n=1 Tax=Uabimicrobium amorphum TaxID=2596890 RepID=A0A5S9IK77_UABAM|nr:alpha/beta hydrolase [Candidatus Uabimicrobium amorphum]BBM83388.1 lysophospholipase L2 [Candidatus Uabimicrobium amorphum]